MSRNTDKRTIHSILLVFTVFLTTALLAREYALDENIPPELRQQIVREQEALWNMEQSRTPPRSVRRSVVSLTSLLNPASVTVKTTGMYSGQIGGAYITIPAGSFPRNNPVRIQLINLINHSDFIFAGIPFQSTENGKMVLLQSTGMFHISFFSEDGRPVSPTQDLIVELPSLDPSLKSNVYRYGDRGWEQRTFDVSSNDPAPFRYNNENPITPVQQAPESECGNEGCYSAYPQIYTKINGTGWWNFDRPNDNFTCVRGRVVGAADKFEVRAVGVDYYGLSYGFVNDDGSFAMNVLKNSEVKIFALTYGKKSVLQTGNLKIFRSEDRTAFTKGGVDDGKLCAPLNDIRMNNVDKDILKDRAKFLKAIEMPDI